MTSRAPVYLGYEFLHPVTEVSRGRFGAGVLIVYDAKKSDHVAAKRVAKRNEEMFERQVTIHIRASSHVNVIRFMGLLPSSTSCFQYAIEYVPDGNLRQLVVKGIGLPDIASKNIFRQLQLCMDYLHTELGIVHGGLRPDHILVASKSRCIVKVANFSNAHPIGALVKMNTRWGSVRPVSWKKQLNRLKSFLSHRTSSLRVSPGSFRKRRSIDVGNSRRVEEETKELTGNSRRRFSISSAKLPSPSRSKEVDVHEYSVDDFLKEVDNDVFAQGFTAPELVNATRYVASPAADNWSLMIIAIYCVTGSTPWENAAVDNRKYTAFLHSAQRSKSFTPNLDERVKERHGTMVFAKLRSKSLSSLVESIRKITTSDRMLSPVFESKVTEILKQPANRRVTLHFCNDFYCRKWSDDSGKWRHYIESRFDLDWMNRRFPTGDEEGENKTKRKKESEPIRERVCSFTKKLEFRKSSASN